MMHGQQNVKSFFMVKYRSTRYTFDLPKRKFHMLNSDATSSIAVKSETLENTHKAAML